MGGDIHSARPSRGRPHLPDCSLLPACSSCSPPRSSQGVYQRRTPPGIPEPHEGLESRRPLGQARRGPRPGPISEDTMNTTSCISGLPCLPACLPAGPSGPARGGAGRGIRTPRTPSRTPTPRQGSIGPKKTKIQKRGAGPPKTETGRGSKTPRPEKPP